MKREGRQHGMVRTYRILPDPLNQTTDTLRFVNRIDTPPAAGLFTKVSTKPTNHSKSSGLTNSNSKAKKSKRRNNNKYKAVLVDGVHFTGASASDFLSSFYQMDHAYDGDYGSLTRGGVYEIEVNDLNLTDENYSEDEVEEDDQRSIYPLTIVEQIDPGVVDNQEIDKAIVDETIVENENEAPISEEEDEIVVDEDGGSVTIGEVVVLLEQVADEDDWCFVGADQF